MFSLFKTGLQKIKAALKKTSSFLHKNLLAIFSKPLNEELLEDLERTLYEADLGSKVVSDFIETLKKHFLEYGHSKAENYLALLEEKAYEILSVPPTTSGNEPMVGSPKLILIVGVNGSGKTTTLAKLAKYYQNKGQKIILAAGDTFRAAAQEQIAIWAERLQIDLVKGTLGADPSSVLFDAMAKAKAKKYDLIIADTAGRLESKTDLMQELEKIRRIAKKQDELAPHETFLIVDATLGQTAIDQTRTFHAYTPLTGIILTKIDGSAKGGVALALYREFGIPILFLGCGEKADDLIEFDPKSYTTALFSA
jgi:fused signal recognition particle receptor